MHLQERHDVVNNIVEEKGSVVNTGCYYLHYFHCCQYFVVCHRQRKNVVGIAEIVVGIAIDIVVDMVGKINRIINHGWGMDNAHQTRERT